MGWDTEFRSPIEIIDSGLTLRTLQDAKAVLLPPDDEADVPPALRRVRRALALAARRQRPKDLDDATVATLRALRLAGVQAIMNTDHIRRLREKAERPKLATPKPRIGPAKAHPLSKGPDIQETLRRALVRAKALKRE